MAVIEVAMHAHWVSPLLLLSCFLIHPTMLAHTVPFLCYMFWYLQWFFRNTTLVCNKSHLCYCCKGWSLGC
jgi:hypothetical protein